MLEEPSAVSQAVSKLTIRIEQDREKISYNLSVFSVGSAVGNRKFRCVICLVRTVHALGNIIHEINVQKSRPCLSK